MPKKKPALNPKGLLRGVHRRAEKSQEIMDELFPEEAKRRKKLKKKKKGWF